MGTDDVGGNSEDDSINCRDGDGDENHSGSGDVGGVLIMLEAIVTNTDNSGDGKVDGEKIIMTVLTVVMVVMLMVMGKSTAGDCDTGNTESI